MALQATIMLHQPDADGDEVQIALIWLRSEPQIGSFLWFSTNEFREKAKSDYGTSAFEVKQVAHWVTDTWNPTTHIGDPIHTICVYVEPCL